MEKIISGGGDNQWWVEIISGGGDNQWWGR